MATGKDLNPAYIKQGGKNSDGKRFRFQNFAQRVAAVDIDVHHRLTADDYAEWRAREVDAATTDAVGGRDADDPRPFALQTLERWVELNQTLHFRAFRREMEPMLMSVPLLLRKREAVLAALTRSLEKAPTEGLKPVLEANPPSRPRSAPKAPPRSDPRAITVAPHGSASRLCGTRDRRAAVSGRWRAGGAAASWTQCPVSALLILDRAQQPAAARPPFPLVQTSCSHPNLRWRRPWRWICARSSTPTSSRRCS